MRELVIQQKQISDNSYIHSVIRIGFLLSLTVTSTRHQLSRYSISSHISYLHFKLHSCRAPFTASIIILHSHSFSHSDSRAFFLSHPHHMILMHHHEYPHPITCNSSVHPYIFYYCNTISNTNSNTSIKSCIYGRHG